MSFRVTLSSLVILSAVVLPVYSQSLVGPTIQVSITPTSNGRDEDRESIAAFYKDATRLGLTEEFSNFVLLLEQSTTDDWTVTDKDGKIHSRKEQLFLHRRAVRHPETTFKGEVAVALQIRVSGKTAQVQVTHTATSTEADKQGRYGTKDATHRIVRVMVGQDTWVRIAGQWKLQKAVDSETKLSVDGTPFKPQTDTAR